MEFFCDFITAGRSHDPNLSDLTCGVLADSSFHVQSFLCSIGIKVEKPVVLLLRVRGPTRFISASGDAHCVAALALCWNAAALSSVPALRLLVAVAWMGYGAAIAG
jgi:hypothetical protein